MHNEETIVCWDIKDIKMSIKLYFYSLDRKHLDDANLEVDFMRSIHREWSYHPHMRRAAPDAMAIIDDFLKWLDATPIENQSVHDFTVRRLIH